MNRLIESTATVVVSASIASLCGAQTPEHDVMYAAAQIVAEIETKEFDSPLDGGGACADTVVWAS